jgi:hypothetical protein
MIDFNKIDPMGNDEIVPRALKERETKPPVKLDNPNYPNPFPEPEPSEPSFWWKLKQFFINLFGGVGNFYLTVKKVVDSADSIKTMIWLTLAIAIVILIIKII